MNTKKDRESIQGTCDLIKIISKSKTKEEAFKKKKYCQRTSGSRTDHSMEQFCAQ